MRPLPAGGGRWRAVAALALGLLGACASDSPQTASSAPPTTTQSAPPTSTQPASTQPRSSAVASGCPLADGSSPRVTTYTAPPATCITPGKAYLAEVRTSKGTFTISLDAARAPQTVNNFVVLARYHYFDGVTFHRIIPGFVVQGGDPLGTGTGGPGYRFADELPPAGSYKVGSVAMANSGPNTNGSQFFVVTGDAGAALAPNYSLFGTVTSGMDVVKSIEATGSAGGRPSEPVTISSVDIRET